MIEIVSIGDELLRGAHPNTNASFISQMLFQHGWKVSRIITVADNPLALKSVLSESLERAQVVITTGGLGPTLDDVTRPVAAELFDSDFHFNEVVAAHLTVRYGKQLLSLEDQATIPEKALPLLNEIGTAPGLIFHGEKNFLICLPGVPMELEQMFLTQVIPYLLQVAPPAEKKFSETLHFCALTESDVDKVLQTLDVSDMEVGIYPGYGKVTLVVFAQEKQKLEHLKKVLESAFSTHLFHSENGKIEEAIQKWMVANKKTLSLAESITGGKVGAAITAIAGASQYFLGSLVVYSNEMKEKILHLSKATLKEHGAVSNEAVKEMAQNLLRITGSDYGIAISGIAGPSG
jgi:nicotinamide-nucleotide amidase